MAGNDPAPTASGGGRQASQSRQRKRGDDEAGPSRVTRSSASTRRAADDAVDGAVRLARQVAAGKLWTGRARTRGRGIVGEWERAREVILQLRRARFVLLEPSDPDSPYSKKQNIVRSGSRRSKRLAGRIRYLSNCARKNVGTDPVEHLASVPEWKNAPSEEDTADYKSYTILQKMGTIVHPLNMDISAIQLPEEEKTRIERVDKCNCSHPQSEDCVRVHVKRARNWIKDQLGEEVFRNFGLDEMDEQVLKSWTRNDKKKLDHIENSIPPNKHKTFMTVAPTEFSQSKTKDLEKYYYNVFLPRRLAWLTREESIKEEDVDTDDEESDEDDENIHRRKKMKGVGLLPSGSGSKGVKIN